MNKLNIFSITIFFVATLTSCEQNLELTNPNRLSSDKFWTSANDASAGVNAIYNTLILDGSYMRMTSVLADNRGDDFTGDSPWPDMVQVGNFTIPTTSAPVAWEWAAWYQCIFTSNQVLTKVPAIEMDPALKSRLIGQAHFLRGLAYYNLANNFKEVPLITTLPAGPQDYYQPTASEEELWTQIFADFKSAKDLLPVSYKNVTGPDQGQIGRATKGAATGMLGKSYVYRKQWQKAADELKLLIDGPELNVYSLVDNYRDNFSPITENNAESLFEIQMADPATVGGSEEHYETGVEPNANWKQISLVGHMYAMEGKGYSDFLPTRGLYNAYKEEKTLSGQLDPRLLANIASFEPGVSETAYGGPWINPKTNIYPRKYTYDGLPGFTNENNGVGNSGINFRVLRYADVLLLYAEALNELDRTPEAYNYINQVRRRVNLADLDAIKPNLTKEQMRDQIAQERFLELAIEGQRIYDLIRWGWFYDPVKLALLKSRDKDFDTWSPGNEYLPIPQSELDVNKNAKPNPANAN